MPSGLSRPFSSSVIGTREFADADERRVESGRRLPHAALGVGAREDAGDDAARRELLDLVVVQRVRLADSGKVDGGVPCARQVVDVGAEGFSRPRSTVFQASGGSTISIARRFSHRAAAAAITPLSMSARSVSPVGRDAQQVEQASAREQLLERVQARLVARTCRETKFSIGQSIAVSYGGVRVIECIVERLSRLDVRWLGRVRVGHLNLLELTPTLDDGIALARLVVDLAGFEVWNGVAQCRRRLEIRRRPRR